jgi:hypothetical protein
MPVLAVVGTQLVQPGIVTMAASAGRPEIVAESAKCGALPT